MDQISDLREQAITIREDISSLKTKLHGIYDKKEEWYAKKDEIRSAVNDLITEVKKIKSQLGRSKEAKESIRRQRDDYNSKTRALIDSFKKLAAEKRSMESKLGIRSDTSYLKQQISRMETRIETEALSFKEEKKIMSRVNEIKKKLKESSVLADFEKKMDSLSSEINTIRKKGDEEHQKLIEFIAAEKDNYSKFIELSKKINTLKKLQREAFENFKALKDEFLGTNDVLQEKLIESSKIFGTVRQQREKIARDKRQNVLKTLEQKTREVEEKLKNKKKLTTEDLIVFQGKT